MKSKSLSGTMHHINDDHCRQGAKGYFSVNLF